MQNPSPAPAAFRAQHGDTATWSTATFESYEHTIEATDPVVTAALATDTFIAGRHEQGGDIVVDLRTAQQLIAGRTGTGTTAVAA